MSTRLHPGTQAERLPAGRRRPLLAAALALATFLPALGGQVLAQAPAPTPPSVEPPPAAGKWPSRPVTLVLPFAPGATADAFARTLAPVLAEQIGQPVVVENRGGANGVIGSQQVARSPADGHTLLVTFATHYSLPFIQQAVPFDPVADFTPIIEAARIQTVLAVHPSHPAQTLEEFLARAKAAPQPPTYGSGGLQLFGEMLSQAAEVPLEHVPYRGGGLMMTDLLGGQIDTGLTVLSSARPHVQDGRLRVLAVLSNQRAAAAPDIPAVTETVPGFQPLDTWVGILAPAGLPPALAEQINQSVRRSLSVPAVRDRLTELGFEITAKQSPAELADAVRERVELYRQVTTAAGITPG